MEVRLVLMDLGVASPQLDDGTNRRGLSFRRQGPLDMRLGGDGDATGETAAELVSVLPRPMLARLFEQAGELGPQEAQRVATAITEWRSSGRRRRRIGSVLELRTVVERCVAEAVGEPKGLAVQVRPPADHGGAGSHEASDDGRYDDANDDDDDEGEGEGQAGAALGAAGLPVNAGWPPASVLLTPPGGLRPGRDEVSANSRSRSARLFVAAWDSALTAVSGPERAVAWPTRSTDRGVVGATAPLRAAERARERRKEGRRLARAAARRAADEARQLEVTGRAVPDDEPAMTAKGGLATRLKLRTRADAGADMAELRTDLDGDASAAAAARGGAVLGVYGNLRIVDDSAPARGADSADGESWSDGLFEPQDGEESLGWADGDDTDGTEAETPRARATGGAAPRISLRGALADPPVFAAPARPADDRRDADDAGSFDDWNAEWQAAKDRR
ncbi:hypothetical protein FNF28_05883 [Cafeteria roenbergensis]|uniref:Uncharacterized protein n=1 Tax=Cafeteria roenbergensis TaxID=33653 RepID=A0A5A8D1R8_CAFRO|nr:hypothetical protein FNF28_05883 [Cafeteria roenbergensis]